MSNDWGEKCPTCGVYDSQACKDIRLDERCRAVSILQTMQEEEHNRLADYFKGVGRAIAEPYIRDRLLTLKEAADRIMDGEPSVYAGAVRRIREEADLILGGRDLEEMKLSSSGNIRVEVIRIETLITIANKLEVWDEDET